MYRTRRTRKILIKLTGFIILCIGSAIMSIAFLSILPRAILLDYLSHFWLYAFLITMPLGAIIGGAGAMLLVDFLIDWRSKNVSN